MESEWILGLIIAAVAGTAATHGYKINQRYQNTGEFPWDNIGESALDGLTSAVVVGPLLDAGIGRSEWDDAGYQALIQAGGLGLGALGGLAGAAAPAAGGAIAPVAGPVAAQTAVTTGGVLLPAGVAGTASTAGGSLGAAAGAAGGAAGGSAGGLAGSALQTVGTQAAAQGGPGLGVLANSGAAVSAKAGNVAAAASQGAAGVGKLAGAGTLLPSVPSGGGQIGAGASMTLPPVELGTVNSPMPVGGFTDVGAGAPSTASRVGSGALRGGLFGGAKGAALDPDDPLRGFAKGAASGAFSGGITGLGASMPTRTGLELMSPLETPIEPMSQGLMTEVPDPTMGQMVGQDLLSRTGNMGGQAIGQGIHNAMTPDMGMPPPPGPLAPRPGSPYPNFGALFGPGMQNPMLPLQSPFMPFLGRKRGGF